MDNEKNDAYYIEKIKRDLLFIYEHMQGLDEKEFIENEILVDSMMFRMIQVAEVTS